MMVVAEVVSGCVGWWGGLGFSGGGGCGVDVGERGNVASSLLFVAIVVVFVVPIASGCRARSDVVVSE